MYQKLLLNCDGGIIDATQQSEQDNCAVVAIGLGGTGVDCLQNLKAKIYNRVKADNPDSAVPSYSHIKFLALDTDKGGMKRANEKTSDISKIDLDTEFFDISYGQDMGDFFAESGASLDMDPAYKEWLKHSQIEVQSARAGAGGIRQLGRYLLMEHAQAFVAKIKTLITQAKMGQTNPKTYVHIFSGLSGGTGAGTFLDVCYLVREAIKQNKDTSFVCGYFFLPDVNIAAGLDKETEAYVQVNGYASLQDLDYCMNFERNGDQWAQNYNGLGYIESQAPPVDICHLLSARDASGNVIPNAYHYAMNVVTDYFMDFVVKTENKFDMESHISNYTLKKKNINKKAGSHYEYCVLGASSATLPFKEVLTYLASAMFAGFDGIRKYNPTKGEVEEFVAKNSLQYNALFAQLTQNCDMTFPHPDVKWQDAKGNDDLTVTYYKDHQARVKNFLERNFTAMGNDLESYNPVADNTSNAPRSLISKIYMALRAVSIDPERGPYYAAAILRSTAGGDLIAAIDGHLAEVRGKYEQENIQGEKLHRTWEQAQRDFFENAGMLNGRQKYEKYSGATRLLVIHDTRLVVFGKMDDLLTRLRAQLVALANNFTDVFKNTIGSLIDTFAANHDYLESLGDNVATYEFSLARIQDLKSNLNQTIKEMNVAEKAKDFLNLMLSEEGIKAWINGNENDIFSVVNKYFTDLFSEYSQRTMTSYLQDKYKTTNPEQLVKNIRDDIMNQLDTGAAPLFWTSSQYNIGSASKIGYITFPAISEEVRQAAEQLAKSKDAGELVSRNSHIQDRITIMRCLVGAPLYGYQGLLQFEDKSVGNDAVGRHLYEGKNYTNDNGEYGTGRDWRLLPSPVPLSLMTSQSNKLLKANAESAKELYELAETKQIISSIPGGTEYGIQALAASFVAEIRSLYEEAKDKSNEEKLAAQESVKALLENPQYEQDKVFIPNDGSHDLPEMNKRLVRIDHFAYSPKLQDMVRREIANFEEIEKIVDELEPKVDSDLGEFFNALYTGTITFVAPTVEFEDEFGMKTVLSSPDMQRGGVPLYQALLAFKELGIESRTFLKETAEQTRKQSPLPEQAIAACRAVNNELKGVKFMIEEATEMFPREVKDVREFLTKSKESLTRFTRRHRIELES